MKTIVARLLALTIASGFACGIVDWTPSGPDRAMAAQEKKEKDKNEGKKGKSIGQLTAKGPNFIEVKADGEAKGRRYVPRWIGGAPANGGGLEKNMLKTFAALKIGSRLQVDWVFEERLRAIAVKVLQEAEKKE